MLENFISRRIASDKRALSLVSRANQAPRRFAEVTACFNMPFTRMGNVVDSEISGICMRGASFTRRRELFKSWPGTCIILLIFRLSKYREFGYILYSILVTTELGEDLHRSGRPHLGDSEEDRGGRPFSFPAFAVSKRSRVIRCLRLGHEPLENQPGQELQGPGESCTIFVGTKPTMNYVLACLTQIQNGNDGLTVKARGRAISRAVDVAQILTRRFVTDMKVISISIDTEQVQSQFTNEMNYVSSIVIKLQR